MKKTAIALVSATLAGSALAAPESYTVDPRHTWPVFEVSHFGFSTQRGRFNKSSGKITLDRAAKSGTVDLVIDTTSIDMGLDKWDEHLKSDEFFDVAKYPTMTFKSTKLVFDGDKVVGAEGNFTLLGVTKPVKLTVSGFRCGPNPIAKKDACGGDVSTTIKRSEFGMKKFVPNVGDDVKILVPVEAFKD
jgi:polyisoprenoid-binding protein YceI